MSQIKGDNTYSVRIAIGHGVLAWSEKEIKKESCKKLCSYIIQHYCRPIHSHSWVTQKNKEQTCYFCAHIHIWLPFTYPHIPKTTRRKVATNKINAMYLSFLLYELICSRIMAWVIIITKGYLACPTYNMYEVYRTMNNAI